MAQRRAQRAGGLALGFSLYALWIYTPTRFVVNQFNLAALLLVTICLAVAVRVLIEPARSWLQLLGALMVVLLTPGPMITVTVQVLRANPDIMSWVWSYSLLVAGAAVASFYCFEAANESASA
jgi:hypothetical protein